MKPFRLACVLVMAIALTGCGQQHTSYNLSLIQRKHGKDLLWGRVVRADGTPVPRALVRVGRIVPRGVEYNTRETDARGYYTYDLKLSHEYGRDFVLSMNPDFGPVSEPIVPCVVHAQPGKSQPAVDFTLRGTATVRGSVVDDRGVPLGSMPVVVPDVPGNGSSNEVARTMTDQQGRFSLKVPVGDPFVEVRTDRYRPYKSVHKQVSVRAGDTVYLQLTAPRLDNISTASRSHQ